jgi:hypothetical protein
MIPFCNGRSRICLALREKIRINLVNQYDKLFTIFIREIKQDYDEKNFLADAFTVHCIFTE